MGIDGLSKDQVSAIARDLDADVEELPSRGLSVTRVPYPWLDATYVRCRRGGAGRPRRWPRPSAAMSTAGARPGRPRCGHGAPRLPEAVPRDRQGQQRRVRRGARVCLVKPYSLVRISGTTPNP
ncbi:hypothetical protein DWW58_04675 [Olsenella sp. AF16-14LB]|uniref:transposase n=1 Tax=unclassified Olsenella TaxID=2638792 RepID=UPI000E4BDF78|nr:MULTISPECIES: transposase [unclassified Olsenella]RGU51309.1 hypothetical protein DWW58_04675 [Olsenella sp. AF16-14LB]RGU82626.1 hypothetical protein DWW44_05280 [Olsenella sp. AF15-43LB]